MGNIQLTREQLVQVKNIVSIMKQDGLNYDLFKAFYSYIEPRMYGDKLIRDGITERGTRKLTFLPQHEAIIGSYSFLEGWTKRNEDCFDDFVNIKDKELFKMYLKLWVLAHETEHAYQKVCAAGLAESCKSEVVNDAYRCLLDLFGKVDTILPHPIRDTRRIVSLFAYKRNENKFVLERNANVDSFEFISYIAGQCGDEEMYKVFDEARKHVLPVGYIDSNMGSFYETYKKIFMSYEYKKIFNDMSFLDLLSDYDKVRLGLPVEEEVRQDVLKLRF